MIVDAWEVYSGTSDECVVFKSEELARNQTIFDVAITFSTESTKVYLSEQEFIKFEADEPIWV